MKTVSLITCDKLTDAHFIKARLENECIPCILTNENFTTLMPHYNNILGSGIQILVYQRDIEKAREIIKDELQPDPGNIICPNCGSKNLVLGFGRFRHFKIFNAIIAGLIFFPVGNIKPKYLCRDCKTEVR